MHIRSKAAAQQRVDQIQAFRAELQQLEQFQQLTLTDNQRDSIGQYHQRVIADLSREFDIDASSRDKQLSLGMKITSFIGALAFGASIGFTFYHFWGDISQIAQIAILCLSPVILLLATWRVAQRESSGYFTKLLSFVCLMAFVLNLMVLGRMFNVMPSENAFLVWAALALLLAYAADTRLLLAAGIVCIAYFISARVGVWSGMYWINVSDRPENFFIAAVLLFLLPRLPHQRFSGFDVIYRVFAMLLFFIPVLVLANYGKASYLSLYLDRDIIEGCYQLAGFAVSALAIWLGIRKHWPEVVNSGNVFFTIFLYTKLFDWFWDWMPKFVFFLLIGLLAMLMLTVFKRLRAHSEQVKS